MRAESKDGGLLVRARKALRHIWDRCFLTGFHSLGWGKRGKSAASLIPGSNIVLCEGKWLVVIYQAGATGEIRVKTYIEVVSSPLKDEVQAVLSKTGLL